MNATHQEGESMRIFRSAKYACNLWTLGLLAMVTPLLMGGCDSEFGSGGVGAILQGVWYLVTGILDLVD